MNTIDKVSLLLKMKIKEIYEQNKENLMIHMKIHTMISFILYTNHKLNENITEYTTPIIEKYNL